MKSALCMAAAMVFLCSSAHANDKLTATNIQSFLNETTALTQHENTQSDADVTAYLKTHLSEKGSYASTVLYEIPGQPATPKSFSLTQLQFIENVVTGRKQMKNYSSDVKLYTHKIAPDGKSAIIETITNERGEMPINTEEFMPFNGTTVCQQTLEMKGRDVILTGAACESRIGFIE